MSRLVSVLYIHIYDPTEQVYYLLDEPQANGLYTAEIFLLIQQSLRNKVASLDEDTWMYEVEDKIRV